MNIVVNEECVSVEPGTTLRLLRKRHYPEADLTILNGFPVTDDRPVSEGDRLVFISKGVIPPREKLEALLVARHSPEVFGRMKAATVGIAGLGGLGSAVALALARMGVGRLILADGDVVEPSNLNRQHYFVDQIGRLKTEALAETLGRVNPFCAVAPHAVWLAPDNIPVIFREAQVVVEAFDGAHAKAMLIDAVLRFLPRAVVVAASGLAGYDSGNSIQTRGVADRLYLVGDLTAEAAVGHGLMAPRVGIAAHHQANAVVRIIMGEDPAA